MRQRPTSLHLLTGMKRWRTVQRRFKLSPSLSALRHPRVQDHYCRRKSFEPMSITTTSMKSMSTMLRKPNQCLQPSITHPPLCPKRMTPRLDLSHTGVERCTTICTCGSTSASRPQWHLKHCKTGKASQLPGKNASTKTRLLSSAGTHDNEFAFFPSGLRP